MRNSKWGLLIAATSLTLFAGCSSSVQNKNMAVQMNGEDVEIVYTGGTSKQKPNGEGEFTAVTDNQSWNGSGTFEDGILSAGTVSSYPLSLENLNGDCEGLYSGDITGGQVTGNGKFESNDRDWNLVYEGEWQDGKPGGTGKVTNLPIAVDITKTEYKGLYTGDTKDGKADGEGEFLYEKDDVTIKYSGHWAGGKMSGEGTLEDNDFAVYFKDMDHPRIGTYTGTTKDGEALEGTFTAINSDGEEYSYTGEWKNNLWDGYGERSWKDNLYRSDIGHYEGGEFKPSIAEWIASVGTAKDIKFGLTDANVDYINAHPEYFHREEGTEINLQEAVNKDLQYKMFIKSPSQYSEALMATTRQHVVQIEEYEDEEVPGGVVTFMITQDASSYDNVYYVYYLGKLDNVYENSKIKYIGLPLDYSSYENIGGGTTKCIVMLMSGLS